MYRIASGTTHGLADTADFIALLNGLRESGPEGLGDFFDGRGELFVSRAPGRLDLMGGIADYSGSLVLELPIAAATHVAVRLSDDRTLALASLRAGGGFRHFEMPLSGLEDPERGPREYAAAADYFKRGRPWAAYVAGAFLVLMRERGVRFERGARLLINSDVPEGKGVSSSAALEVATMQAVAAAYNLNVEPRELAFLCQRVENMVACAPCGVMDQMTSACGETGRLLELLCQPGELRGTVALPEELAVWGVDSGIRHSVGGADYGTVRTAAFMGYRIIAEAAGLSWRETGGADRVEVEDPLWGGYLANVGAEEFAARYEARLPERMTGEEFLATYKGITDRVTSVEPARTYPVREATRHPVYEHERVGRFAGELKSWRGGGQAEELGALMYESHESYSACGLGSGGTDLLVQLVREAGPGRGLFGAKITGGGSGGTVAVLGRRDAGDAVRRVADEYALATGREPLIIEGSSPGAVAFGHLKLVGEV
ncbi:MAG TPA: galactokinase family protein [Pyrinomonadaceae bacterium]|nr:galactokinase family protein [Pyrinomonadaceae bacterium]